MATCFDLYGRDYCGASAARFCDVICNVKSLRKHANAQECSGRDAQQKVSQLVDFFHTYASFCCFLPSSFLELTHQGLTKGRECTRMQQWRALPSKSAVVLMLCLVLRFSGIIASRAVTHEVANRDPQPFPSDSFGFNPDPVLQCWPPTPWVERVLARQESDRPFSETLRT